MKPITWASQVEPKKMEWLWYGWLPKGQLVMVSGSQGDGKGVAFIDLIARLSTGDRWPHNMAPIQWGDEFARAPRAKTLLFNAEDSSESTIVPRLMKAGADLNMVGLMEGIMLDGKQQPFSLANHRHLAYLDGLLKENPDIALVVFDPISSYIGDTKENSNVAVRTMLTPVLELAKERNVSIVGILHLRKDFGSALTRVMGSGAWTAVPRVVIGVKREDDVSYWFKLKSNLESSYPTLTFECEWDEDRIPHTVWTGMSKMEQNELMGLDANGEPMVSGGGGKVVEQICQWLADRLKDGPVPAAVIFSEALEDNFHERSLKSAKKKLGVLSERKSDEWLWRLPTDHP